MNQVFQDVLTREDMDKLKIIEAKTGMPVAEQLEIIQYRMYLKLRKQFRGKRSH